MLGKFTTCDPPIVLGGVESDVTLDVDAAGGGCQAVIAAVIVYSCGSVPKFVSTAS